MRFFFLLDNIITANKTFEDIRLIKLSFFPIHFPWCHCMLCLFGQSCFSLTRHKILSVLFQQQSPDLSFPWHHPLFKSFSGPFANSTCSTGILCFASDPFVTSDVNWVFTFWEKAKMFLAAWPPQRVGFPWIFLLLIHLTSLPCLLGHLDRPCSPWNSNYKRHCLNAQANCPRPMEIICLGP